jgi:hypothetical protein
MIWDLGFEVWGLGFLGLDFYALGFTRVSSLWSRFWVDQLS